jgi:hypothetical protein
MKPKPLDSLKNFTVPVGICVSFDVDPGAGPLFAEAATEKEKGAAKRQCPSVCDR